MSLFCEHSELYSATWPASGSMRNGSAYRRPPSAPPTSAGASSSSPGLPTPRARDWKAGGYPDGLEPVLRMLPTPTSSEHTGPGHAAQGGMNLRTTIALLPTPSATPYGNNQSASPGAAVRPSLDSLAPKLLPTPTTADSRNTARLRSDGTPYGVGSQMTLVDATRLLPNPPAPPVDAANGPTTTAVSAPAPVAEPAPTPNSAAPVKLLPTPRATDGAKGGPNQRGSAGDLTLPSVAHRIGAPTNPRSAGGNWFSTDPLPGQLTIEDA